MPELKRTFTGGKMNKDLDERVVPKGQYVDALNIQVNTSDDSDVGTVQTLKGNSALSDIFTNASAKCIGTIANETNDKLYWFVSDSGINAEASTLTHLVYSDYIIEYDQSQTAANQIKYIVVENYKVTTVIQSAQSNASNLTVSSALGLQVGMIVETNNTSSIISQIEQEDGYAIIQLKTNAERKITTILNGAVTFRLPANKRALGFSNFVDVKPLKLITGINIIDDLLFWTDGLTEPKKINIERCRYGSQQATPITYPNGTRTLPTLLIVNGDIPRSSNAVIHSSVTHSIPLTYRNTTVIRKSPTNKLVLTMFNTLRGEGDFLPDTPSNVDGSIVVSSIVNLPSSSGTSSDFFFTSNGVLKANGETLPALEFPQDMDWMQGDIIEFYPDDEDAGVANDVLATLEIINIITPRKFEFEIQSISSRVVKPFTTYNAKLKESDPLFEFKFPRFAYRWRYEDGEYSTYSPFSEVAFLPEKFDYLPKKGFNLGMTNNLRKLIISGFKPKTTPLDVVEIDILYKESNSPNVYTVETIKSPSVSVANVSVNSYEGDEGWFGKINGVENPNTLTTDDRLVSVNSFVIDPNTPPLTQVANPHFLGENFPSANIKVGDKVDFTGGQTAVSNLTITSVDINGYVTLNQAITTSNALGTFNLFRSSAKSPAIILEDPQGSFEIKTDMIHAALPSNQLLRPWDNVPIKALAQDVTKNRIVYGNYTQNYNLEDINASSIKPTFDVRVSARDNIRENVRFDDATTLRHFNNTTNLLTTVNWYDVTNQLALEPTMPERSLKSIRDYQVGIVFSDEFGRETPVQTHKTGVVRIPKSRANKYNNLRIHLDENWSSSSALKRPAWASHYKYYIKENANEYYNLAMDRFYSAEDGNIWLSFPSSERNKIDEETFLILKKQHDNNTFVTEDARYKILAISNEAPLFIKTKIDSYGSLSTVFPISGQPKYQASHVDVPTIYFDTSFEDALTASERVVRISSTTSFSFYYDIANITNIGGGNTRITVRKPFGVDMSFTTDDGTNAGAINPNLSIEVATKKVKTLPEFLGRFFVKIHKDGVFEKNILSQAPGKQYVASQVVKLGQSSSASINGFNYTIRKNFFQNQLVHKKWFVSTMKCHSSKGLGSGPFIGIQDTSMFVQYHDGADGLNDDFGITKFSNNFGAHAIDVDIATKFTTVGQLFRFKGDSSIYKITFAKEVWIKNYAGGNTPPQSIFDVDLSSNHSVGIQVQFEKSLATSAGDPDGVNLEHTGYDPRVENTEGTTTNSIYGEQISSTWEGFGSNDRWGQGITTSKPEYHRTIEFLEEFVGDESYTSDNPAIWETEPKESVDIDIYYEASECYAVDHEFNAYKNKLEATSFWTSWNATNYYNCFSFNNGVESNRIRDDFNTPTIDKGVKASTVLAEQYRQETRKSGLIYSGLYNSTSGINNLNQFIMAEKITKDLNPTYGSIQKLYANETNLISLCEDRIIRILANKDALFNADGNSNITSTNNVLGSATPYSGDYGISTNPESFAVDQYRSYFTDKSRGKVIRLSKDGITPISDFGMSDYFKDSFNVDGISLIGSFDEDKGFYNLSIGQGTSSQASATVSFSEKVKGWVTFQSWQQETGISFNSKFYTFNRANLYVHHANERRNNFYSNDYDSSICLMFNDAPSSVKSFSSLSYEGTQSKIDVDVSVDSGGNSIDNQYYNNAAVTGWYAESIETDLETGHIPEFKDKEGKWFNFIKGNQENTLANLDVKQFSTQGIGMLSTSPSAVNDDGSNGEDKRRFRFTIQDLGDND